MNERGNDYDFDDNDCGNCGGSGYVANCQTEYACVDPEEGCDECMRRCDWCNPPTPKQKAETDKLRKILGDVLATPDPAP
jgi:hypothetical protein